ncbi:MAG: bifunctional UDP-sugar hydrolase/5'-nucleotidase [bacterium]|nr:bifunctional UDP-sugar hydrolase/5'-nucleotidase [bacterium]
MKASKCITRFMFILVLASLLIIPTTVFAKEYSLTILHTNDQHGHFEKFSPYANPDAGGVAAQSTLINIVRAEVAEAGGYMLLLSAGDVNMGVPESDLLDAEPDFKLMNMLGYDAMALGNHEFDKGRDVLLKQKEWAEFPFLAANIVKKDTGETLVDPYVIKEFDGLKIAILGLTAEDTPVLTFPENTADLEFKDAIETAKELVPKLKEEADIVIALTHIGLQKEVRGGYKSSGDLDLAKEVSGIDAVVGGHTQIALTEAEVVNGTPVVQAGEWSQYVGRLDLTFDSDADKVTGYTYNLLPVNMKKRVRYNDNSYYMYVGAGYVEDKAMLEAVAPYVEQADELLSQSVGEALIKLDGARELIRSQETNLGNLVTDALRAKTGAEIALHNGGGIRSDIAPGPITYRDILKVHPFGNTLALLDMTGAQIMEVLNYAATIQSGNGAFLHVSGLKWTMNRTVGDGIAENVTVEDAPIDLEKTYKVVTINFLATGGDGYAMLKPIPYLDTGFVQGDTLREYISNAGKVEPQVEGRLTIVE